jgi:hypothetical protein
MAARFRVDGFVGDQEKKLSGQLLMIGYNEE